MKDPKKAVVYVRVNTTIDEAEKQLEELWKFAESKGLKVTNAYYEVSSGTAHVHGRTIWHMLEDAKENQFNTVVIRDISRISRNATEALDVLNELKELGIKIVSQRSGTLPSLLEVVS